MKAAPALQSLSERPGARPGLARPDQGPAEASRSRSPNKDTRISRSERQKSNRNKAFRHHHANVYHSILIIVTSLAIFHQSLSQLDLIIATEQVTNNDKLSNDQRPHQEKNGRIVWPTRHKRSALNAALGAGNSEKQPSFTEPIGNHTVPVGRDVQLWCKTTPLNHYRTAWLRVEDKQILSIHDSLITRNYRIGVLVSEASSVLTIKNVQNSDKGGYMCQINSVPMRFAVGYLDVLLPPTFERDSSEPAPTTKASASSSNLSASDLDNFDSGYQSSSSSIVQAREGANATLSCRARGYPEPSIQWRREDNEPLELDQNPNTNVAKDQQGQSSISKLGAKSSNESLYFSQVNRMQAGAYLCIASNGVPPAASKRLLLDVQFAPVVRVPQSEVGISLIMSAPQSEATLSALANNQWGRPVAPSARLRCYVELNPSGSFHWIKLAPASSATPLSEREQDALISAATDPQSIESEQLINSDKYEIVILDETLGSTGGPGSGVSSSSGPNDRKVEMRLNIRAPSKQDLGYYRCLSRNQLGIQWGNVKLSEAPVSSASGSGTFAFNELFRSSSYQSGDPIDATGALSQSGSQQSKPLRSRSSVHTRSNSRTSAKVAAGSALKGAGSDAVQNSALLVWIFIVAISFGFSLQQNRLVQLHQFENQ